MSVIPVDLNNVKINLQNDAQQLRTLLDWVENKYQGYAQNLTTPVMDGLGISAGDQAAINAFIGNLNRIKQISSGVQDVDGVDMRYDIAAILGVF